VEGLTNQEKMILNRFKILLRSDMRWMWLIRSLLHLLQIKFFASALQKLGYLFVAGGEFLKEVFTGRNHQELSEEDFTKFLESENLEVRLDEEGHFYLAIGDRNISNLLPSYDPYTVYCQALPEQEKAPITFEKKEGNIVYQIQNLNVYITADVVQQLNVNPEKVITMIKDKLTAEIGRMGLEALEK